MENNRHKWVTQVVISLDCNFPTLVVLTITIGALWKKAFGCFHEKMAQIDQVTQE